MTNEEKQEIISSVIQSLQTNSATIDQLSEVESCSEGDFIELNKGRKISAENLAKDVSSKVLQEANQLSPNHRTMLRSPKSLQMNLRNILKNPRSILKKQRGRLYWPASQVNLHSMRKNREIMRKNRGTMLRRKEKKLFLLRKMLLKG
ncbi:hypothetical protein DW982_10150 [Phocaeicola plebeius]|nr:hypothetical protein DW982_10150 [Phocaeicola plebeius]